MFMGCPASTCCMSHNQINTRIPTTEVSFICCTTTVHYYVLFILLLRNYYVVSFLPVSPNFPVSPITDTNNTSETQTQEAVKGLTGVESSFMFWYRHL